MMMMRTKMLKEVLQTYMRFFFYKNKTRIEALLLRTTFVHTLLPARMKSSNRAKTKRQREKNGERKKKNFCWFVQKRPFWTEVVHYSIMNQLTRRFAVFIFFLTIGKTSTDYNTYMHTSPWMMLDI